MRRKKESEISGTHGQALAADPRCQSSLVTLLSVLINLAEICFPEQVACWIEVGKNREARKAKLTAEHAVINRKSRNVERCSPEMHQEIHIYSERFYTDVRIFPNALCHPRLLRRWKKKGSSHFASFLMTKEINYEGGA